MRKTLPAQPAKLEYYGGLQPSGVIGANDFQNHNALATWDDGGRAKQLSDQIMQALDGLKAYGAEQARDAVLDYASGAFMDGALIDGRAAIVLDQSNEQCDFRVHWDLDTLLQTIINDAIDKKAYDLVDDIHRLCERTALMLTAMAKEPEPLPEPPRQRIGRAAPPQRVAAPMAAAMPVVRRTPRG